MHVEYHPKAVDFLARIHDKKAQEKAKRKLGLIEQYGIGQLRKAKEAEPVRGIKEKMEEIKVKGNKMEYRFFGGDLFANIYGIFHGYIKRGGKLDRGQVDTALGRRREMIEVYVLSEHSK